MFAFQEGGNLTCRHRFTYSLVFEDDQAHVDYFVKQLAAQRGIKLEER